MSPSDRVRAADVRLKAIHERLSQERRTETVQAALDEAARLQRLLGEIGEQKNDVARDLMQAIGDFEERAEAAMRPRVTMRPGLVDASGGTLSELEEAARGARIIPARTSDVSGVTSSEAPKPQPFLHAASFASVPRDSATQPDEVRLGNEGAADGAGPAADSAAPPEHTPPTSAPSPSSVELGTTPNATPAGRSKLRLTAVALVGLVAVLTVVLVMSSRLSETTTKAEKTRDEPTAAASSAETIPPEPAAPSASGPAPVESATPESAATDALAELLGITAVPEAPRHTVTIPRAGGVRLGLPTSWNQLIKHKTMLVLMPPDRRAVIVGVARGTRDELFPRELDANYLAEGAGMVGRKGAKWEETTSGRLSGWRALATRAEGPDHVVQAVLIDVTDRRSVLIIGTWAKAQPEIARAYASIVGGLQPCTKQPSGSCDPD